MKKPKPLNKNDIFIADLLWGGTPIDVDWVRNSKSFQSFYLDLEKGKWFAAEFNRSKSQCLFLLNILRGDFEALWELEMRIKQHFIFYCPGDLEECKKILILPWKSLKL